MLTHFRSTRLAPLLAAVALGLGASLAAAGSAHAQAQEPVKHRIEITDNGFNDQPDFTLEVEQGQVVELTFVFAQKNALADNHVIAIRGLGLETNEINYYSREGTLKFVADKPGTFELGCELDCEVHGTLNKAHIKVKGGAGGTSTRSAALVATKLAAYPSAWEVTRSPVKLTASLKDADGTPVSKATVRFLVETEFAGTKGEMEIGAAKTDANGTAATTYTPTFAGNQRITARFEGMGLYGESEQSLDVRVRSAAPGYLVEPRGLEGVSDRVPLVIFALLLGIWSTFSYVLFQVFRISCSRMLPPERSPSQP